MGNQNQLIKIKSASLPFSISIVRFEGRKKAVYHSQKGAKIYVSVITGAFEVDGRLLHQKDGLALWNIDSVELEALSNNAVVVVLEMFST